MKSSAKDSAGKETNFSYSSAGCDEKSASTIGNPNADSISLVCVSGREIKVMLRMKGKVTVQSTATVSADGKHLRLSEPTWAGRAHPPKCWSSRVSRAQPGVRRFKRPALNGRRRF